jgi:peptidoglycan-N-acetylglucosamine deacetylase
MRAWLGTRYSRIVSRCVRGVVFRLPAPRRRTPDGRPAVYLTFDDGPTDACPALLDLLAEHDVPATFFLLGENALRRPDLVRRIVEAGHAIGNHSLTHVDAWRATPAETERDFEEATCILENATGTALRVMRPPFGRLNKTVVRWSRRHGQRLMMWDAMPPDFEPGSTPDRVARVLQRSIRPGSIVVLHDNAKSRAVTVPALRKALPLLRDAGWALVPAEEASIGAESRAA